MDGTVIIPYLIKTSVSLAVFYGIYMICLRRDTFLRLKRFFLLFAILFSLSFPLINIEIPVSGGDNSNILPTYWLSQIDVYPIAEADSGGEGINLENMILILLSSVSVLYAIRLLTQFAAVFRLRLRNKMQVISGFRVVNVEQEDISPFSFFNWIFISTHNRAENEIDEILLHEHEHIRQYHSLDIIIVELLRVCFWWNPFVWLLRNEVRTNLEYLADEGVLKSGVDTQQYQLALLKVSCKNAGITFANNFNVSQLKKRIEMMNKEQSSIFLSVKYLMIVPVGCLLLLGNAVQATASLIDTSSDISASTVQKPEGIDVMKPLSNSQSGDNLQRINNQNLANISLPDESTQKIYERVEEKPSFPGGETALQVYIKDNLVYPASAINRGTQGRVTLRFVVENTGEVTGIKVLRGISDDCDAEAVRVVANMPRWEPGRMNGENVAVYFTLPIFFRLQTVD